MVVALLVAAMVAESLVLSSRPQRVEVALPDADGAPTWLIVGLDDRAEAADPDNGDFGTGPDKPIGARTDVIVLVRPGRTALSVSRDIVVLQQDGRPQRLGNLWLRSPQALVDGLCTGLQVPVTHLVAIDMRGFQTLVDTLGGIEVTLPEAMRDRRTGLSIEAGSHTIDGRTALALVRSRQGEVLRNGRWVPEGTGEAGREARAATVMADVVAKAKARGTRNPALAHTLAWRVLPDVTLDADTPLAELASLRNLPAFTSLPVERTPNSNLAALTDQSRQTLTELGWTSGCTVRR